jgi:hypothetical protein
MPHMMPCPQSDPHPNTASPAHWQGPAHAGTRTELRQRKDVDVRGFSDLVDGAVGVDVSGWSFDWLDGRSAITGSVAPEQRGVASGIRSTFHNSDPAVYWL